MKTVLVATETWTEHVPASKMVFVNAFGKEDGSPVNIPERYITTYKGETFRARNKSELAAAIGTGKWTIKK